jgi:hypothetical protein
MALKGCMARILTNHPHLESGIHRNGEKRALWLFELAHLLLRFNHVARFIVNANHGMM